MIESRITRAKVVQKGAGGLSVEGRVGGRSKVKWKRIR